MLKKAVLAVALIALSSSFAAAECGSHKSAQSPVPPVAEAPQQTPAPTLAAAQEATTPVQQDVAQADQPKAETLKTN